MAPTKPPPRQVHPVVRQAALGLHAAIGVRLSWLALCCLLLCAAYGNVALSAESAPVKAAKGIYVASDPLTVPSRALPDDVYTLKAASGVYVRLIWKTVEPEPGRFDFLTLDTELIRAVAAQRQIALSIITGGWSPTWLRAQGIQTARFRVGRGGGAQRGCITIEMPVPWDSKYIEVFGRLVNAVAAQVRETPGAWDAVRIVKLTGITRITEELRVPADLGDGDVCGGTNAIGEWTSKGYTVKRMVDAWAALAEKVAQAFPGKLLAQDILERNDFPPVDENGRPVAQSPVKNMIIEKGLALFPDRFAVQWNGLTAGGRLAQTPIRAHNSGAALGWQTNAFRGLDGAGCNDERLAEARTCDPTGYERILARGLATQPSYIEIWPDDLRTFPDVVQRADNKIKGLSD